MLLITSVHFVLVPARLRTLGLLSSSCSMCTTTDNNFSKLCGFLLIVQMHSNSLSLSPAFLLMFPFILQPWMWPIRFVSDLEVNLPTKTRGVNWLPALQPFEVPEKKHTKTAACQEFVMQQHLTGNVFNKKERRYHMQSSFTQLLINPTNLFILISNLFNIRLGLANYSCSIAIFLKVSFLVFSFILHAFTVHFENM